MSLKEYTGVEPGYFLLCKLFSCLGFTWDQAYKLLVLFIIFSVAYSIMKNVNNICIPAALFLMYPAIMNSYNTSTGVAMGVMLIAIQFLIEDKKNCTLKYIVGVLIATSIHTLAMFYLIFLLLKIPTRFLKWKLRITVALGIILFMFINRLSVLIDIMGETRYNYYFLNTHVTFGTAIVTILWQISIVLLVYFLVNFRIGKKIIINKGNDNKVAFYEFVEEIFLLLLVICPLYFYTFTYIRVTRSVLIYIYILYAKWLENKEEGEVLKQFIFLVWVVLTILGFNIVVKSDFEQVIKSFYLYNNFHLNYMDNFLVVYLFLVLILCGMIYDIKKFSVKS